MKKSGILFLYVLLLYGLTGSTQTLNWDNLKTEEKSIVNLSIGADYGLTYGVSYGFQLNSKRPIILTAEYSFPSGSDLTDDFKWKAGGQIRWLQSRNFYLSSKFQGIFRRYENGYARLLNFGAELSSTAGYYKKSWFVAGELGFDKAIVTHFKHSDEYKSNYPGVEDGWYEPSTGGNVYFGLQTGYSVKNKDMYLKIGKISTQDFNTSPMLPFYAQLGVNIRIRGKR